MRKEHIVFRPFAGSLILLLTVLLQSGLAKEDSTAEYHSDPAAVCVECHEDDQPHDGNFGQDCSLCHSPDFGWDQLDFDHGLSRFPLIGTHTELDCESCHSEAPASAGIRSCRDCHLEDEPHDLLFGDNCSRCHNPNGWEFRQFDHKQQTGFPLQGAHQELVCTACHKDPISTNSKMSQDCVGCHRKDEPHRGDFGSNCGRCHQPTKFKDIKVPN